MGWEGKAEGGRGRRGGAEEGRSWRRRERQGGGGTLQIFTRRAPVPESNPPGYHHGYIFNNTSLEDFIRIDPREVMQYHLHVILNNVLLR